MTDAAVIQLRGLRDFLRWLGGGSDGARVVELPGVTAAVVPATPQRSLVNSVVYEDQASLASAYDDLVSAYQAAGVFAWTVWTPDHDLGAIDLLVAQGHKFDGKPLAMTLDLERLRSVSPGTLDWDIKASFEELGEINDLAYGIAGDGIAPAIARAPAGLPIRLYRARAGGEAACVLATIDHDDDLGIYFVATRDARRGQGIASRLLSQALVDGRERGLRTSSLQSSAMGAPIYKRLGYEAHFGLHLYERR